MSAGVLTAERDGTNVKLTMEFPPGYDHCFSPEYLAGTETDPDTGEEREVWASLYSGTRKYVYVDSCYVYGESSGDPDEPSIPPPVRTYRALAYKLVIAPHVLETDGSYTASVTA